MRLRSMLAAAIIGGAIGSTPAAAQTMDSSFVQKLCKTDGFYALSPTEEAVYPTVTALRYVEATNTWYAFMRDAADAWCEYRYSRVVYGNEQKTCRKATVTKGGSQLVRGSWSNVDCPAN
ncbi:MAG: hypothetical protein AB7P02_13105 [Alphaproteobacteria bacterium]